MSCAVAHGEAAEQDASPELADIVRLYGDELCRTRRLASVQLRALRAIKACRTAVLGGHRERCDRCGASRSVYHSCRNRHCPKCQTLAKERWIEARRADLLPLPYFHTVFTLPHELNRLAQYRPRVIYNLLFEAAAQTLQAFGRDPKHLGGEIGITAILHTWGQNLDQHIHLHCLVTGGALAADRSRWLPANPRYLFPVRALSPVFRGKFIAGLERAFDQHLLSRDETETEHLMASLRSKSWVVYTKRPFAGPESVIKYLGRYTHRIAISNHRLLRLQDGIVHFQWRDYRDHDQVKIMKLPASEFLRRFLLHVLPRGFMRIRHFGLLANRHRASKLDRCRELLAAPPPPAKCDNEGVVEMMKRLTGQDLTRCPFCSGGIMRVTRPLPSGVITTVPFLDSS
jgi:hypothetical protein